MSRFFEFLQTLNAPLSTSEPHTDGISENYERATEANRILSVLQRSTASKDVVKRDTPSDLDNIGVEDVDICESTHLVFHTDPSSPAADRFRLLRMRLGSLSKAAKLKIVMVTSPMPKDGKSTIVLNLATALAESGKRSVLIVDADLHNTSLNHQLGITTSAGLTECLKDGLDPLSAIRHLEPLKCYLLPAGGVSANPTELLQTAPLSKILQRLSPHFDWIIVDSPPVIPLTDAVSLASHADATILVARAGRTPREAIDAAIELVGRKHVIGVILNGIEALERTYSRYAGYYHSARSEEDAQTLTATH